MMMKKNAVNLMMLIFAMVINIIAMNAQTKSPSVEVVDENNNKQNLILKKLDIDIKVVGNLAVTTIDMTFTNDFPANSRALEGTLIFPLAEGQSVNRLAMDFNGIMREGVIVEKEKGRVVFEEIERRGVDPALLEMTTSNNYKLRIFPIMPGKERRIIIAYEEILKSNAEGMAYNLPLEFEKEIKEFKLRANVFNEVQPIASGKAKFEKDDNSYNLEYEYSDYKAKEMFSFSIPTPENQKSILCEMLDGEKFFVVNRSIEIPKAEKLSVSKITILWDCSHSSNKRDTKKEIELLREYFKANPKCSVELITFNYKIRSRKEYQITNGKADELIKAIEKVRYDGGSNFDCIDLNKNRSDMIMMFTDGISSLGNSKTITSEAPINVINSNLTVNNYYLNDIANNSGGSYINLLNLEVEQAVKLLTEKQYRLISIENNASETEENFPQSTQNLIQDLSIAGKMKSDKAEIKLNYGYGNKVKRSEIIFIDANENKVESGVISRIWAKKKLDNLTENAKKNKAEMLAIGQKYNIISQNTSLIVLETARDYYRYKIALPQNDSKLLEEYNKIVENRKNIEIAIAKYEKDSSNQNIDLIRMIERFRDRKEWYSLNHFYEFSKDSLRIDSILKANNYHTKTIEYNELDSYYDEEIDSLNSNKYYTIDGEYTCMNKEGKECLITVTDGKIELDASSEIDSMEIIDASETELRDFSSFDVISESLSKENIPIVALDYKPSIVKSEEVYVVADKIDMCRKSTSSVIGSAMINSDATISANDQIINIELSPYSSSEEYFIELKTLEGEEFRDKYFKYKAKFGNVIGYYIDIAELLTQKNNLEDAEEVITNIAELGDENQEFMRLVAYKLQNLKRYELAKNVFEYITEIRAEEPQSFRDLAIINEEMGNYQTAADLYYKVALGKWDRRFSGIEMTTLTEWNILIAKHYTVINTSSFNTNYIYAMPLDLRIVLRWDLDNTDIDLWVTDPRGEKCYYSNKNTKIGGLLPEDFTGGNGPEEFLLKTAMKGKYIIECDYFGSSATKLTGGTTIFLDIYTNYGKPHERKETKMIRLKGDKEDKETIKIGEIEIE